MHEWEWISELIIIIYGLSVIGYFIDFIQTNQKANKIAFWLLSMAWVLQTIYFIYHMLIDFSFPVASLIDSLFFFSWVLITFSLIINKLFPVHFIVLFINIFGFLVLLLYVTADLKQQPTSRTIEFAHEILIGHISLAFISYGFFTVSFLFSIMYLIQYRLLKEKKGLKWLWRFGNLNQLEIYSFKAITLGVPLLLLSVILGLFWADVAEVPFYWDDMKTIGSLLVLAIYIVFLGLGAVSSYRGKRLATYNIAAFLFLLINFFLFNFYSNYHF